MITPTYEHLRHSLVSELLSLFTPSDPETMLCESIVKKAVEFLATSSAPVRGANGEHVATLLRSALDSLSEAAIDSGRYEDLSAGLQLAIEHFDEEVGASHSGGGSSEPGRGAASDSVRVGLRVPEDPVDQNV